MKRLSIFASGYGSNFQTIADAIKRKEIHAEISLVVCDQKGAHVLERAKREGVPAFSFSAKEYPDKASYEKDILKLLYQYGIDYVILAGYMRLIGPTLLQPFSHRIINIHPSLLPSFPGKDAIGQAFDANVKETGVTIHYVDEGMDTGPVITQKTVPILAGDTKESLQKRIQETEHHLYPEVIRKLCGEKQPE